MFGKQKKTTLRATATMPLTDTTVELLKLMQFTEPIPDGAKYVAFLEDGNACFLDSIDDGAPYSGLPTPHIKVISYYTDVTVEI